MKCFEYIQLEYDGILNDFCALGSNGWEIILHVDKLFILKREITGPYQIERTRKFYREQTK